MIDYERRSIPDYTGWSADTDGELWFDGKHVVTKVKNNGRASLCINSRMVKRAMLVCLAFHGPKPPDKIMVAHRNDISHDDRPENVYWATALENSHDAIRNRRARQLDYVARQLSTLDVSIDVIPATEMWKFFPDINYQYWSHHRCNGTGQPYFKVDARKVFYRRHDVEAWVERNRKVRTDQHAS